MEVEQEKQGPGQAGDDRRLDLVQRAIAVWTGQLVDLTGRNNLLYYRDLKRGTLSLDASPRHLIYSALAGRPVRLSKLFLEEEALEDALRRTRAVKNKANAHFEERGIETLYLACGMATWTAQKTATPAAPVLLVPIRLTPKGAAQSEFELSVTGELEVNPTFLQMLKSEFDIACDPAELLESAGIEGVIDTPEELTTSLAWLHRQCSSVPGFGVTERFVVANFSYARMPMVRDLESSAEVLAGHDLVAALAGDAEAQATLRERHAAAEIPAPDSVPPADEFLVLDADSSQNYAINAVLAGKNLVIKGPPGTGKSQTISNLVSTLVARGKKVLFVAEKRAAIDAVLRRLDEVEIGDLVLDLHGGVSSKRKVAKALEDALNRNATVTQPRAEALHEALAQRRGQLNEHPEALHGPREPWGLSFFEANLRLRGLSAAARSDVRFRGPTLEALSAEEMAQVAETLKEFVGRGGLTLRHSDSPWAQATIVSEEEAAACRAEIESLRQGLPGLVEELRRTCADTGLKAPDTLAGWGSRFDLWRRVAASYATWTEAVYALPLEQTIEAAAPLEESTIARASATVTDSDYRGAKKALREALAAGNRPKASELYEAGCEALTLQRDWRAVAVTATAVPTSPEGIDGIRSSYEGILSRLRQLSEQLGGASLDGVPEEVIAHLDALLADISTLAKLPHLHRLRTDLERQQLIEFLASIDGQPLEPKEALGALAFAWLTSVVEHLMLSDTRLAAFDGARHHELVREFQTLDREHIETTPQRVRRLCAKHAVDAENASPRDAQLIRAEANKRRKHLPTRQLFSAAPEVMLALKPCWAMSPLVVSQVLPSDRPYFDVVIFDEASQVRPAEAITAIARGKQLVVAGDEHQLPPTSFFDTTNPEVEEDSDESYLAVDGSYESILEALAAFIDFRVLGWHYRSRDERLINFSNVHVYDRHLTTFPGVSGPDCISLVPVPYSPGQEGSESSSIAEVDKVVELILDHAEKRPDKSLGVIAMGVTHADRIGEALRLALEEREDEEELQEFFGENRHEPFFVKNLERVQGDERDAIILSVGYGKNADGRLLYRFGPLNYEGGERRLNVAITRAKERMTVVSSFDHRDMDPERSKARGVQLLRGYLEYCASGGTKLGEGAGETPKLNPFEIDVRDTLAKLGIELDPQHGCAGYRIDFAAKHPRKPGRMVLAIECDGATYHSSQSARDRDRLRQEHLERLGWTFHRIWSQDWFADKEAEAKRAKAAFEAAVLAADKADDGENGAGAIGARPAPPKLPSDPFAEALDREVPGGAMPTTRRGDRPIRVGRPNIDSYSHWELIELIRWIESDTLLRTKEQMIDAARRELGFQRRGSRIVTSLEAAIAAAQNDSRRGR